MNIETQAARICKLPLLHPDYRYGLSRNPYSDHIKKLNGRVFSDQQTEANSGRWRSVFLDSQIELQPSVLPHFGERRPVHVEIGCNAGHVVVEWAKLNPSHAYFGIDWKFKPIFRAAEKGIKRGLQNLIFLRAHADRIHYMFGSGEIDHLYLFFPDPWPKKAQRKNRFVSVDSLRRVAQVVRIGGTFYIKTDHEAYFDWMQECVGQVSDLWRVEMSTRNLHEGNPNPRALKIPDVTLFETLFIERGLPIYSLKLVRL